MFAVPWRSFGRIPYADPIKVGAWALFKSKANAEKFSPVGYDNSEIVEVEVALRATPARGKGRRKG